MKNLKRKYTVFFCVFWVFVLPCFANEFHNFTISLEPLVGYQHGMLYEYVYVKTDDGGTRLLSELDWKNTLLYAGGKLNIAYKIFTFFVGGGAYFPMRSGTMEDSDWLNENDYSMKTNFSISENSLKSGGFFSTGFYAAIPVARILNVCPRISADLQKKTFSAENGYGWYGNKIPCSWDDEKAIYYPTGELYGISYERLDFSILTGLSLGVKPVSFLQLAFAFDVSFFSLVDSLDTHFGSSSNAYYYDKCYAFFSFGKATLDAAFSISKYIALKASASCTFPFSSDIRGTTYFSSNEVSGYSRSSESVSGASSRLWDFSISIIFKDLQKVKLHLSDAQFLRR